MDIITAERALAEFVAEKLSLTLNETVFRESVPEGLTGVAVRIENALPGTDRPAELSATVEGIFDEPGEARDFAERLFGGLPLYGASGFIEIAPTSAAAFGESEGRFTAAGGLRALFA